MRALLRGQAGQILPWALIMLLALLPLVFGILGAAAAYLVKDQAQTAADAAALAAAEQARLWEALTVSWHTFGCSRDAVGDWTCRDGPAADTNLGRHYAAALFAPGAGGLPGWAAAAGCQRVGPDPAARPPAPNPTTVCDGWRLQPGGLGAGYGLGFPAGSDPQGAAAAYLQRNAGGLAAAGLTVRVLGLQVDARTGEVDLTVRVTEPGDPLRLLTGHTTTVTVQAGARRRIAPSAVSGT